jgi:hypothetical protein
LIHLGFGIEFKQPAIIAEALAQAAVHETWIAPYLLKTEAASTTASPKTLPQLIEEIQTDQKVIDSVHWEDGNKIRDGILKRAPQEMISYAKQWTVLPGELEKKTVEMINTCVWFTAAAQHPPKQVFLPLTYFDLFDIRSISVYLTVMCLSFKGQNRLLLPALREQQHILPHLQRPALAFRGQQNPAPEIQGVY